MRIRLSLPRLSVMAAALGLALGACDGPLFPEGREGVYVLTATGDAALPAVLFDDETYTVSVLADTFHLRADGTGRHSRTQRGMAHGPGAVADTTSWSSEFTYDPRGRRFELSYPCPVDMLAICLAPPHEVGHWHREHDGFVLESLPTGYVYLRDG